MAYLSLYRKYRPQTFAEILGQEHVSATLANAITEDRVAHAYLFTGPRGTGKTSSARVLAKALNCVRGPTPSPCGECGSCRAIVDGSSLDVIEMDAASHSKVDETREILSGVPLASAGGRKKVYVIDEVHMLSTQAFNALLKTLEEPPSHVVFILATTEAHKVPATIVSRTQRFDFRRISTAVLVRHLSQVAEDEGIDIEPEALEAVARHAEGGARDALSLLDQLRSLQGRVEVTDVESMLGSRDEESLWDVFDSIAEGDVGALFLTMHSLMSKGADPRQLALSSLGHARSLLLLRTAPDAQGLLDVAEEDIPRFAAQADRYSTPALLRVIDLLGKAVTEMRNAPNHRLLLEVALVRAADPDTDPSALGLLGRIERLERRSGIEEAPAAGAAPPRPSRVQAPPGSPAQELLRAPEPVRPASSQPRPRPAPSGGRAQDPPSPREQPPAAASEAVSEVPQGAPAGEAMIGFGHVKEAWAATMQEVGKASKRIQGYLNPSRPLSFNGNELVVEVQSKFHQDTMTEERNRAALADAVHACLGVRPVLSFVARGSAQEEAKPQAPPVDQEHQGIAAFEEAAAVEGSELDPIELVKRGLGAEVVEERT